MARQSVNLIIICLEHVMLVFSMCSKYRKTWMEGLSIIAYVCIFCGAGILCARSLCDVCVRISTMLFVAMTLWL